MENSARVVRREAMASGRFLALDLVHFTDERGRARNWEAVSRIGSAGAVIIVPVIRPEDEFILVRQFRPPVGKYTIEFPAGLIEPGESVRDSAARELLEETGYAGTVDRVCECAYSSPGMSGEWISLVFMTIDGGCYRGAPPQTFQEDSECIETLRVPRSGLSAYCCARIAAGDAVDAKVLCCGALTEA